MQTILMLEIFVLQSYTVEPPITDSARYGLPPYNGQVCPRLILH